MFDLTLLAQGRVKIRGNQNFNQVRSFRNSDANIPASAADIT
jgi:hypothetical protein